MYVHTFFIALMILLMGICCIYATTDLLQTRLGHLLALGCFIFWVMRLLFQFFVFSPRLWKGKRFETYMHIIASILWSYVSVVFFMVYLH